MNGYHYYRNRFCPCQRCRMATAMGPAVLVTLGILFLLDTMGVRSFHYTWPVLLIVIGVVKVLGYNASSEGHIQRFPFGPGPQQPPPPSPSMSGTQAPPSSTSGSSASNYNSAPASANDPGNRGIDNV
jgi:hypothetical protein